jgi:hypothetical protein
VARGHARGSGAVEPGRHGVTGDGGDALDAVGRIARRAVGVGPRRAEHDNVAAPVAAAAAHQQLLAIAQGRRHAAAAHHHHQPATACEPGQGGARYDGSGRSSGGDHDATPTAWLATRSSW